MAYTQQKTSCYNKYILLMNYLWQLTLCEALIITVLTHSHLITTVASTVWPAITRFVVILHCTSASACNLPLHSSASLFQLALHPWGPHFFTFPNRMFSGEVTSLALWCHENLFFSFLAPLKFTFAPLSLNFQVLLNIWLFQRTF